MTTTTVSTVTISVSQTLPDDLLDTAWQLYHEAFKDLAALAVQRHLLHRHEFVEVAGDPRIDKYIATDLAGRMAGLATFTNDLDAVPLISPQYFARRWPHLYAARNIWYCGFVAVHPRGSGAYAELVEAMWRAGSTNDGLIGLDFCRFNDQALHMGRSIRLMLHRFAGDALTVECADEQRYMLYQARAERP